MSVCRRCQFAASLSVSAQTHGNDGLRANQRDPDPWWEEVLSASTEQVTGYGISRTYSHVGNGFGSAHLQSLRSERIRSLANVTPVEVLRKEQIYDGVSDFPVDPTRD